MIYLFICFICFFFFVYIEFVPQVAELLPKSNVNNVKIVYLLTLNGRAVRQVHRLLKMLYSKNHYYYIHVDSVSYFNFKKFLT